MSEVIIQRVRLAPDGRLRLRLTGSASYPYIYRSASSVRWDPESEELYVLEVSGFDAVADFKQIITAVAQEYGDELLLSQGTVYVDVPVGMANTLAKSAG
jgi:hypothetical protein